MWRNNWAVAKIYHVTYTEKFMRFTIYTICHGSMYLHDTALSLSFDPSTFGYLTSAYVYRMMIIITAHTDSVVQTM